MEFEWDENKRPKTLRERKIDFVDMIDLWDDPSRQEVKDLRRNYGEPRFQTIGTIKFNIYFVIYIERVYEDGVEVIRIISARRANKKEREMYEKRTFSARAVVWKKE
jgi:uncharacterized DUF497 family protein